MRWRSALVLAAAAAVLLPGCLTPYQVRVPDALLAQVPGWTVTPGAVTGGWLGPKTREMRYAFDRDPDAPAPFAGSLQVFSIRSLGRFDSGRLLDLAHQLVDQGAKENDIVLADGEAAGARTLHSGVATHWFVRQGRTAQSGNLFDQDVAVRILGEVGHDGRSSTSFLVIAMAQTSRTDQCPVIGACQPQETNLQTWIQMVGDAHGSVQGATSATGFVDNLETRP